MPLAYTTQKEGTLAWFDLWFIPADAAHPGNAHLFLNFLLRPEVVAPIVVETRYATPNLEAIKLLPAEIRNDPACLSARCPCGSRSTRASSTTRSASAAARGSGRA